MRFSKKQVELSLMDESGRINSDTMTQLFNPVVYSQYESIDTYVAKNDLILDKKQLRHVKTKFQADLLDVVTHLSVLHYRYFEASGDWGDAGEQQQKIGLCRLFLDISPSEPVTQDQSIEFYSKMDELYDTYAVAGITKEEASRRIYEFKATLLGQSIPIREDAKINMLIRFFGLNLYLQAGVYSGFSELILGKATCKKIGSYSVYVFTKELMRTPNVITPLVALTVGHDVFLRGEAFRTIFHQKWMPVYDEDDYSHYGLAYDDSRNISEGIKQYVLSLYGASNQEETAGIEKKLLADMRETVMYHEIGHSVFDERLIPTKWMKLAGMSTVYGETVYSTLLEFLADFSPSHEGVRGPMQNMVEVAKTDPERAQRMFYLYLSDVWFYDTQDEYMYLYSDFLCLILLKYVHDDRSIDFDGLNKDIVIRENRDKDAKPSMVERVGRMVIVGCQEIARIIQSTTYKLTAGPLEFKKIESFLHDNMRDEGLLVDESPKYWGIYWQRFLRYAERFAPDSHKAILDFIASDTQTILKKMMTLSCGKKKAQAYQYNHRKYIMDRFKELGLVAEK